MSTETAKIVYLTDTNASDLSNKILPKTISTAVIHKNSDGTQSDVGTKLGAQATNISALQEEEKVLASARLARRNLFQDWEIHETEGLTLGYNTGISLAPVRCDGGYILAYFYYNKSGDTTTKYKMAKSSDLIHWTDLPNAPSDYCAHICNYFMRSTSTNNWYYRLVGVFRSNSDSSYYAAYSDDSGETWTTSLTFTQSLYWGFLGGGAAKEHSEIAVLLAFFTNSSSSTPTLYTYKSTDGGATWSTFTATISNNYLYSIAATSDLSTIVFNNSSVYYPYYSTNYGSSWATTSTSISGSKICYDPSMGEFIGVASSGVIYIGTSDGKTWTKTSEHPAASVRRVETVAGHASLQANDLYGYRYYINLGTANIYWQAIPVPFTNDALYLDGADRKRFSGEFIENNYSSEVFAVQPRHGASNSARLVRFTSLNISEGYRYSMGGLTSKGSRFLVAFTKLNTSLDDLNQVL